MKAFLIHERSKNKYNGATSISMLFLIHVDILGIGHFAKELILVT